jgi:hypothetical protein
VTLGAGATVTRQNGSLTGNAMSTTNYNVTYGLPAPALSANTTAGNEVKASLGTGALTFSHTGALVTVPNTVSAVTITSTSTGGVTFSGNATATAAIAGAFDVNGGATVTVTGSLSASNAAGGITTSGASKLTAGATTVGGAAFAHSGTGAVTVASLSLPGTAVLTVSSTGAFTSTGDISVSGAAGKVAVSNTSTATVTAGTVTVTGVTDTAGDDADVAHTLSNSSTGRLIVNGAITEYHVLDARAPSVPADILDGTVGLVNATGGRISIGASSTLGGQIANAERDHPS